MDDVMDQDSASTELPLLPMSHFFLFECHRPYYAYFEVGHAFWDFFEATMYRAITATVKDALAKEIDLAHFEEIAAQKTCFAKIPIAAVCLRYQHPEKIAPWAEFADLFGRWHQMYNDFFDWRKDLEFQTRTYFLSEADRRRQQGESVTEWFLHTGLDWGRQTLNSWMAQLKSRAVSLDSPELMAYLGEREALLLERCEAVRLGLQTISQLLAALEEDADRRGSLGDKL
jgi:hypothetical protein